MKSKTKYISALSLILNIGLLSIDAMAQSDSAGQAPQCINKEPEQITQDMISTPEKGKKYTNPIHGFGLIAPRLMLAENAGDAGKVSFSPDWCGGEPGSASPFQWTISFFNKRNYKPEPIQDFDFIPKAIYVKPKKNTISCGKLNFQQDKYKNDDSEYSYIITDRIVFERGEELYQFDFRYGVDGQALKAGYKSTQVETRFIAQNEQLKCDVLSSFEFIPFNAKPHS